MKLEKRTYRDRARYLIEAVKRRRRKLKEMAVEYKGGQCVICGYKRCKDALDFHHLDPSSKNFGFSVRGITRSWTRTKNELENCILICANCHRELHAGLLQLPRVIGVEKRGEIGETLRDVQGNTEPSP